MRLVSYRSDRGVRAGVLEGDRVIDAGDAFGAGEDRSVRDLLEAGALGDLEEAADGHDGLPLAAVELLAPVPDPEKIVCIGLNYAAHAAEGREEVPKSPTIFGKFRNALAAPGATVTLPAASAKVDYEGEIAFVIGRTAREVDEAQALDHLAGYMLFNDLSARDLQYATPQWMAGKVFDGSAPSGPWLVTPDEAGPPDGLELTLTLNGEQMQNGRTEALIFSIPTLLAHLSRLMTLRPGDIVATGTPEGVGGARQPRVWLQDGDELIVSSPTLGQLETRIAR